MNYREHDPHPALSPFVECFWSAEDGGAASGAIESVVPDGCPEWIFHLGAPYRRLEPDGSRRSQPASLLVGALTRPLALAATGPVHTMGVRFRPGGASAFLPMALSELTDSSARSADVWSWEGRSVEEQVLNAGDDPSRLAAVERFLRSRLRPQSSSRRALDAALALILHSRGAVSIGAVAGRVGKSRRQLERVFSESVGLSPKTLARVARFQNVLRQSGHRPRRPWSDLAAECGYADQAHMIREFRQFSGSSPAHPAGRGGDLAPHFVAPDRLDRMLGPDVAFLQDVAGRAF